MGKEICSVYTRDQVFKGNKVDCAPELLIVPRDDVNIKTDPFSRIFVSRSGNFPKANHGPNGIFFATGPSIGKSEGLSTCLEDIAPTALALMGIRPPDFMDGKIIQDVLLDPRHLESLRVADITKSDVVNYAFSQKDEQLVMENLKRLGYT